MPSFPPFRPHPLVPGGHAQTLVGALLPHPGRASGSRTHTVQLDDGDAVVLHDDRPSDWDVGDTAALLVHGLTGDHTSGYMVRITAQLVARGVRVFRMDARGWGAAALLARLPANAGRSEDARAALHAVAELCPGSSIRLAGFSLGANLILKMLGEDPAALPAELLRAAAVNAPIDLDASVRQMERGANRVYDFYFTRMLIRRVERIRMTEQGRDWPRPAREPSSLRDFDDTYTAPLSGYDGVADYYARASSGQFLSRIRTPTLMLTADDDPIVPRYAYPMSPPSPAITLHVASGGGHLGYIARSAGADPDRRWMDARVVQWLLA